MEMLGLAECAMIMRRAVITAILGIYCAFLVESVPDPKALSRIKTLTLIAQPLYQPLFNNLCLIFQIILAPSSTPIL